MLKMCWLLKKVQLFIILLFTSAIKYIDFAPVQNCSLTSIVSEKMQMKTFVIKIHLFRNAIIKIVDIAKYSFELNQNVFVRNKGRIILLEPKARYFC